MRAPPEYIIHLKQLLSAPLFALTPYSESCSVASMLVLFFTSFTNSMSFYALFPYSKALLLFVETFSGILRVFVLIIQSTNGASANIYAFCMSAINYVTYYVSKSQN